MTTTIKAAEGYTSDVTAKAEKLAQLSDEVMAGGTVKEMDVVMQNLNDIFVTLLVKSGDGIYSIDVCTEDNKVLDVLVCSTESRQTYANYKVNTFMLSSLKSSLYVGETIHLKVRNNSNEDATLGVLVEQKRYATDNRPTYDKLKVDDVTAAMLKPPVTSSTISTVEVEEEEKPTITYAELYKPKVSNFMYNSAHLKADINIQEGTNCEYEIYNAVTNKLVKQGVCQNKFNRAVPGYGAYKVRFRTENNGVRTNWTKFRYAVTDTSLNSLLEDDADASSTMISWVGFKGVTKYYVYVREAYEGGRRSEWRLAGTTEKHTLRVDTDFYKTMRYEVAVGCEVKLDNGKTIRTKENALSTIQTIFYNPYMAED